MLKTPRQVDEHGTVTLDPRLPADLQQSDEAQERWLACANIAMLISGKSLDSPETGNLARAFYRSDAPLHRADTPPPIQESAEGDFERLHLRNRKGEFRDKPKRVLPKKLGRRKRQEAAPGVSLEDVKKAGLDEWPKPSQRALDLMDGHTRSADRWYEMGRTHTGDDSLEHPPYQKKRRARHDLIVGDALAGAVTGLLGEDHPITRKLRRGGRLSGAEKQQVREAAHAARSGESPDALFMAGGPAAGKSTTLEENPDLKPENSVEVDPDAIKELLPEFQELRAADDRYAATAVHLESGDIAARLADEAEALHLNVVIDGTGDSEPQDFIRQLQRKHNTGYDVSVLYATTDTDSAIKRAIQRSDETGRFVPVPAIKEQHAKVSRNFEHVIKLPWISQLDVFDDDGHIGEMHGGSAFQALEPERVQAFRDKAKELRRG